MTSPLRAGRWWQTVRPAVVFAFYALVATGCVLAIADALKPAGFAAIVPAFASLSPAALTLAGLTVVGAFTALVLIERLMCSSAGEGVIARQVVAPFVATTLSLGAGFGAASGSALRIRLYAPFGVGPTAAIYLATTTTTALLLGGVCIAAIGAACGTLRLATSLGETSPLAQPIGAGVIIALALLVAVAGSRGRSITLFRRSIRLPSSRMLLLLIALGAINWICSAVGLYVLLPEGGRPSVPEFITAVSALKLGSLMTGAPGGLGVFETLMLSLADGNIAPDSLTAALLTYRIMSFVAPVLLAAVGAALLESARAKLARSSAAATSVDSKAADDGRTPGA